MVFDEEQRKTIAYGIRCLDALQSKYDASYEQYEASKSKFYWSLYVCGGLIAMLVFKSFDVQAAIGMLGVVALPIVIICFGVLFFNARNKYHQKISEQWEAGQALRDLGLSYTPKSKHMSQPFLTVLESREELDVNEFNKCM